MRSSAALPMIVVFAGLWCGGRYVRISSVVEAPTADGIAFVNGAWYDGEGFRLGPRYVVDGRFIAEAPVDVQVVDLAGGFVVPAFGDAHSHLLNDTRTMLDEIERHVELGILYLKSLNNTLAGRQVIEEAIVGTGLEVAFANAGLTRTLGYPMVFYEARALGLYTPQQVRENEGRVVESRLMEGRGYHLIDTVDDLERTWPRILDAAPDFIKIYLLNSESFGKAEPLPFGRGGLDPALVPVIVSRAHTAGLRVSAHVETAEDFRTAVAAGVDEIAHLPGHDLGTLRKGSEKYRLSERSAREAAAKRVVVVTTVSLAAQSSSEDEGLDDAVREIQTHNLRVLRAAGVRLAIGANGRSFNDATALGELRYLRELGVFSDPELLRMLVEASPQAVFPDRRVGRLDPGYEATFLVLGDNPLNNLAQIGSITARYKNGRHVGP